MPACRQPSSLPTSPTTVSNAVYQSADIHLACLHLQRQCRILNASLPSSIQPTVISNLSVEFCIPACRHPQLQCQFFSPACRFSFSLRTSLTAVSSFVCNTADFSNCSVQFCMPAYRLSNFSVNFFRQPVKFFSVCEHLQLQCRISHASLPQSPTAVSNFVWQPANTHPACRHLQLQCGVSYDSVLTSSTAVSNFACQPAYIFNSSVEFCMPACRHPSSMPTSPTTVSNAVFQPTDIHLACRHLQLRCRFFSSLPTSI